MDNLEKLKDTAKEVEKESSTFMEPKIEKPKGAKGRPKMSDEEKASKAKDRAEKQKNDAKNQQSKGPDTQQQASQSGFHVPSAQIIAPLTIGISAIAVKYAGDPRASMTPEESGAFCEIGGKLLDKYAPNVFDKYGLEAVLLITLGMYGTRVIALKKVLAMEKMKQAESIRTKFEEVTPEIKKDDELNINQDFELPKEESWQKSAVQQ